MADGILQLSCLFPKSQSLSDSLRLSERQSPAAVLLIVASPESPNSNRSMPPTIWPRGETTGLNEWQVSGIGSMALNDRMWVVMFEWVIHFRPFSRRPT